jgi:hypothetical protein
MLTLAAAATAGALGSAEAAADGAALATGEGLATSTGAPGPHWATQKTTAVVVCW